MPEHGQSQLPHALMHQLSLKWRGHPVPSPRPQVTALESAPFTEVEAECAEQMRSILLEKHVPYESLIDSPETLLRCSAGHVLNGALWTRFTVQYNLFAGSIVAVGSDEQRAALVASQGKGTLGCFAFTEKGAGVLSGAFVETTAHFDPKGNNGDGEFVINSPTPSASKTWISQGMCVRGKGEACTRKRKEKNRRSFVGLRLTSYGTAYPRATRSLLVCRRYAEEAVILAELFDNGGKSLGPHLFWSPIADRPTGGTGGGRPVPRKGVKVDTLPPKTALKGLDNACVRWQLLLCGLS